MFRYILQLNIDVDVLKFAFVLFVAFYRKTAFSKRLTLSFRYILYQKLDVNVLNKSHFPVESQIYYQSTIMNKMKSSIDILNGELFVKIKQLKAS